MVFSNVNLFSIDQGIVSYSSTTNLCRCLATWMTVILQNGCFLQYFTNVNNTDDKILDNIGLPVIRGLFNILYDLSNII